MRYMPISCKLNPGPDSNTPLVIQANQLFFTAIYVYIYGYAHHPQHRHHARNSGSALEAGRIQGGLACRACWRLTACWPCVVLPPLKASAPRAFHPASDDCPRAWPYHSCQCAGTNRGKPPHHQAPYGQTPRGRAACPTRRRPRHLVQPRDAKLISRPRWRPLETIGEDNQANHP